MLTSDCLPHQVLGEKRKAVGDQAFKLKNGLQKLSDTAVQVGESAVDC